MPSKVKGELTFLGRSLLWEQEKPYRMRFALANGFPESNFIYETQEVAVKSLRDGLASLSLDTNGFEIHDFTSKLEYPDFEHYDKVRSSYIEEISDFVKSLRGASHVHALDHEIRRRHPTFPLSSGEQLRHAQPSNLAHIDLTLDGASGIIREIYGDSADQILMHRFEVVTVWKPLRGPVTDWPLAICDTRSVNHSVDVVAADAVYQEYASENAIVHFNPQSEWHFLPYQREDQITLFKAADSSRPEVRGCPHTAFEWKHDGACSPRESIDVRLLVMYADIEYPQPSPWFL